MEEPSGRMRNVVLMIAGNADISIQGHLLFTNLESATNETTVKPMPDYFDGARVGDVHFQVKQDLNQKTVPAKHADVLVVPNLYLQAKAPKEVGTDVARLQACYNGAHRARAMHSVQNYGKDEPGYDNNVRVKLDLPCWNAVAARPSRYRPGCRRRAARVSYDQSQRI